VTVAPVHAAVHRHGLVVPSAMRYAVSIPPFTDPSKILDMATMAEQAEWDAVFVWDHLRWDVGLKPDVHDPWALLAAMAVRTERIRLGTCVTPVSRRRPHVLAKQLVTLDHLSAGRSMLGVGLGEPADADFGDFGDEADPRARAARLDEGLEVLDHLLRGDRVDHDGEHFRVHAELRPAPVQRPRPPIFVAGVSPHRRPLERALRWEGFFPIAGAELLSPDAIANYLEGIVPPRGWDLFAALTPGHDPSEFAAVGVTWLVEGAWPVGDWVAELSGRIIEGPPRTHGTNAIPA
jgi:alkanesulfonate monooxygenase SsuD/methylene tetrahydromethanopterin reductase-like flavin-dependent oxidoreductase (luciferase family)